MAGLIGHTAPISHRQERKKKIIEEVVLNTLRLDLESLEVERLDVSATGLNGGVELLGMGHASTELSQSCTEGCAVDTCACSDDYTDSSCIASECSCDDCEG